MSTNILVVDDSAAMRALVSHVVSEIGHTPILASSGEEAVEIIAKEDIGLVVLDVELPGINGFETCQQLRAAKTSDWFPVIYLSASTTDEYIVNGLDAGGDAYVAKPINARVLEAIIRAMGRIADMKKELAAANRELQKLAHYDGLTQILNRRGFEDSLARFWKQAQREKSELALMLIDVDFFKPYNDNYGHLQGDDTLRQVAQCIDATLLRPIDIAARYGGEEFVVLLPGTNLEGAETVGQRLLESVQALKIQHEYSKASAFVSVSIGLALSSEVESETALIEKADKGLYAAKESGRNRIARDAT